MIDERPSLPNIAFDLVRDEEIPAAHLLETAAFLPDEVSPIDQFDMRRKVAPELFLGAFVLSDSSKTDAARSLVGFACATRSRDPTYTQECMKTHEPKGTSVCIHNVVVASSYQGRGIALALLKEYITRMRNDGLTERVLLVCHDKVQRLYDKAGFEYVGLSPVVIGLRQWHEMRLVLKSPSNETTIGYQNADSLLPALNSKMQRPISSLSDPKQLKEFSAASGDVRINKYDIMCPREGCGRLILKAGTARLMERDAPKLEKAATSTTPIPAEGSRVACWLMQSDQEVSQSMGTAYLVAPNVNNKAKRRKLELLSCPDCDSGPLGWYCDIEREFYLLCTRVGYCA